MTMTRLPRVIESGMFEKNGQRKPGTTRGSPSYITAVFRLTDCSESCLLQRSDTNAAAASQPHVLEVLIAGSFAL